MSDDPNPPTAGSTACSVITPEVATDSVAASTPNPTGAAGTADAMASRKKRKPRTFFGHPMGLANLFGVEMWERFSFYGMQAILTFYIYYSVTSGGLGYSKEIAYSIVGAYGGLVYLASIIGSWISDRWFGAARSLVGAGFIIMLGHLSLAVLHGLTGVVVGLIFIAFGAGTLKAASLTVLGDLYDENDIRQDAGFSVYYMGINIGAFIGPILTGIVQRAGGFHWAFALAAIGMFIGLMQYLLLAKSTIGNAGREVPNPLPRKQKWLSLIGLVAGILIIWGVFAIGWVNLDNLSTVVTVLTVICAVGLFIVILTSKKITEVERSRVIAFIPLFIASALFWSLYQQQFTILPAFADRRLNLSCFGHQLPPSVVQSINPIFIIIFAPIMAALWQKLGTRQPHSSTKFAWGVFFCGLSFLVFVPFARMDKAPIGSVALLLFVATIGELFLSPVGNSLATRLAPKAFHSQMVALFFLSVAIGSAASGSLAQLTDVDSPSSTGTYFLILGIVTMVLSLVFFLLRRWIDKKMVGIH